MVDRAGQGSIRRRCSSSSEWRRRTRGRATSGSGELLKLGVRVSATAIRTVLRREGIGPAPSRTGPSWSEFLRSQARAIMAFDFFAVETAWLRTLYVIRECTECLDLCHEIMAEQRA